MPKNLENKLKAEASAKGFSGKRAAKYVYGSMNKMGVMKGNKVTPKGEAMEQKAGITARVSNYNFRRPVRKVQVRNYK